MPRYLGYERNWSGWELICEAKEQYCEQNFCYKVSNPAEESKEVVFGVDARGGCVLLMQYGDQLWQVAVDDGGKLRQTTGGADDLGTVWEFFKV